VLEAKSQSNKTTKINIGI